MDLFWTYLIRLIFSFFTNILSFFLIFLSITFYKNSLKKVLLFSFNSFINQNYYFFIHFNNLVILFFKIITILGFISDLVILGSKYFYINII